MKIIFATYVDKQDIIEYPVWYLKKADPNLMVFGSDQHNANHLAKSNIQSRIIGFNIKEPSDIATA
jgi:hypothetical protein